MPAKNFTRCSSLMALILTQPLSEMRASTGPEPIFALRAAALAWQSATDGAGVAAGAWAAAGAGAASGCGAGVGSG